MRRFRHHYGHGESLRQAPQPPVPRMARSYHAVSRAPIDRSMYPAADVQSVAPSIHDVPLVQGLFANDANFCSSTSCEVFEMGVDDRGNSTGSWRTIIGNNRMDEFVQVSIFEYGLSFWRSWRFYAVELNPSDSLCIDLVSQPQSFAPCRSSDYTMTLQASQLAVLIYFR